MLLYYARFEYSFNAENTACMAYCMPDLDITSVQNIQHDVGLIQLGYSFNVANAAMILDIPSLQKYSMVYKPNSTIESAQIMTGIYLSTAICR